MASSEFSRRHFLGTAAAAGVAGPRGASAQITGDGLRAARRWAEVEFAPSTLSLDERMAEMTFFVRAAAGLRERFRAIHGYDLDVPVNWKAYEDIAAFFTNDVGELDGRRVWGHMDYGARDHSIGWRFTDAWLALAGAADPGLPTGAPIDDWGIRVEGCRQVGASMARGGATDSPAAIYALRKYLKWLRNYAPPEAAGLTFSEAGPVPGRGDIAQQIFWYTAFTPEMSQPGLPVLNADGTPRWRVAPMPRGAYWRDGMKHGYQDCGAWTLMESTPVERRKAAWLYAQFCTCRSISLKKSLVGLTPIRSSDLVSSAMDAVAPRLGGLVEFYRSPARRLYTPTGSNVPQYPLLAQAWWQTLAAAVHRGLSPEEVMRRIAADQDALLARLAQDPAIATCRPAPSPAEDPDVWLARPGAPWPALDDEEGEGRTIAYEDLLATWQDA